MKLSLIALVLIVGCGDDHSSVRVDASSGAGSDASVWFCAAGASTSNITFSHGATSATYTQLHAGGTWFTGPFAPVAGPDMSASLLFTSSTDPLPSQTAGCCAAGGSSCCMIPGIVVETDGLGIGNEVGAHPMRIHSFQDPVLELTGTLMITTFVQPFEQPPGRIAGSLSATGGGTTVSGTFDNTFCAALLSQTI